ncbi:MAG: putative zinc-binding protein [bacterium]
MNEKRECCQGAPKLIFPCSGAADTGEITDRVARRLTKNGVGKMFCLAGIGGRVEGIVSQTQAASLILAIDGCDTDCAKRTLENAGLKSFQHLRVTDLGLEKGKSPATHENMTRVVEKAEILLSA